MWFLIFSTLAAAEDVEIAVSGPSEITVTALQGPVFVPACRGVSWARFDASKGTFEPTPAPPCGPLSPAVKVEAEGHKFTVDVPLPPVPGVGFHMLRPTVVVGQKCKDETPFPVADCVGVRALQGPQVLVRDRGTAVPIQADIEE